MIRLIMATMVVIIQFSLADSPDCEDYWDVRPDASESGDIPTPILPHNRAGYYDENCPSLLFEDYVDLDGDGRADTLRIIRTYGDAENITTRLHTKFGAPSKKALSQVFHSFAADEVINDLSAIRLRGKVLVIEMNTYTYVRMASGYGGNTLTLRFQKGRWEVIGYSIWNKPTCNAEADNQRVGSDLKLDFNLSTGQIIKKVDYEECMPMLSQKECDHYLNSKGEWRSDISTEEVSPAEIMMACDPSPVPKSYQKTIRSKRRALPLSLENLDKISTELYREW